MWVKRIVIQDLPIVSERQPLRKLMKRFDFIRLVGDAFPHGTVRDVTQQEDRADYSPQLAKDLKMNVVF